MYQSLHRSYTRPNLLGGLGALGDQGQSLELQALGAHSRGDHAGAQSYYTQAAQAYENDAATASRNASMPGGSYTQANQLYSAATSARSKATEEAKHILAQQAADAAAATAAAQAELQRQNQLAAQAALAEQQRQAQIAAAAAQALADQMTAQQAAQVKAAQAAQVAQAAQAAQAAQQPTQQTVPQVAQLTAQPPPIIAPTVSTQPVTSTTTQQKVDVVTTSQPPAIIPAASSSAVDSYSASEDFSATSQASLLPLGYNDLSTSAAPETPTTPGTAVGFDWVKLVPWVLGLALLSK